MKVCVSTAYGEEIFQEVIDLDAIRSGGGPSFHCAHNRNIVFRVSAYNERTKREQDNGNGSEASWWSLYIGEAQNILDLVQKDKGSFPAHDERILKPALVAEKLLIHGPVCWVYCIPKPRVQCSGRFRGPDKQPWADTDVMAKLFRHILALPEEFPVIFANS